MKKNNLKIQYDVYCILSIFCFVFHNYFWQNTNWTKNNSSFLPSLFEDMTQNDIDIYVNQEHCGSGDGAYVAKQQ